MYILSTLIRKWARERVVIPTLKCVCRGELHCKGQSVDVENMAQKLNESRFEKNRHPIYVSIRAAASGQPWPKVFGGNISAQNSSYCTKEIFIAFKATQTACSIKQFVRKNSLFEKTGCSEKQFVRKNSLFEKTVCSRKRVVRKNGLSEKISSKNTVCSKNTACSNWVALRFEMCWRFLTCFFVRANLMLKVKLKFLVAVSKRK
jgi:hypothetical protein